MAINKGMAVVFFYRLMKGICIYDQPTAGDMQQTVAARKSMLDAMFPPLTG
jgi:hypothetical protein